MECVAEIIELSLSFAFASVMKSRGIVFGKGPLLFIGEDGEPVAAFHQVQRLACGLLR
jgi:hypothetical protein